MLKRLNMMNWLKKLTILRPLILVIQLKKTDYSTKINNIYQGIKKIDKITDHDCGEYINTQSFIS